MGLIREEVIKKEDILTQAYNIVNNDRAKQYGTFTENYTFVKGFVKLYKDIDIDLETVALVMIGLKLSRNKFKNKQDNLLDLIGYIKGWDEVISYE